MQWLTQPLAVIHWLISPIAVVHWLAALTVVHWLTQPLAVMVDRDPFCGSLAGSPLLCFTIHTALRSGSRTTIHWCRRHNIDNNLRDKLMPLNHRFVTLSSVPILVGLRLVRLVVRNSDRSSYHVIHGSLISRDSRIYHVTHGYITSLTNISRGSMLIRDSRQSVMPHSYKGIGLCYMKRK